MKAEHRDLKARFDRAKAEGQLKVRLPLLPFLDHPYSSVAARHTGSCQCADTLQDRSDLLGSASTSAQSPTSAVQRRPTTMHESPFAPSSSSQQSLWRPNHPPSSAGGREDFALREHSFLQESENSIDNYIAQGRAVLENLVEQRGMLKGTKRRLLDAANTLGMSRETIGWVERRT